MGAAGVSSEDLFAHDFVSVIREGCECEVGGDGEEIGMRYMIIYPMERCCFVGDNGIVALFFWAFVFQGYGKQVSLFFPK